MSTNNKDYNIGAKIAKQISNIQDNMTMNDNIHLNRPKANADKPCCPYCGSEAVDIISNASTRKDGRIAYYCKICNRFFKAPRSNDIDQHQTKTYTIEEERDKDYASGALEGDLSRVTNTICELMAEKGFTETNQALDFLAKHYQETKDMIPKKKKSRTSPGKMTIDDIDKYVRIDTKLNPIGHFTTNAAITITYVKAFTDTMDSIDTVILIDQSIDNIKNKWNAFIKRNHLHEDCISSFHVELSMWDKAYVQDVEKAVDNLIAAIYVDDDTICKKKITDEDRQEILKNILSSGYFAGSDKIIYPHVYTTKESDTGRMIQVVKRYWGE